MPTPLTSAKTKTPAPGEARKREAMIGWAALVALVLIILLYAGLIPLGQWQADEYDDFGKLAGMGWPALWQRLEWSPRLFSELIFHAYGFMVNYLRRPLIAPFLGLLWCGPLVSALYTAWQSSRESPGHSRLPELLAGFGLLAAFLTSGPLFEVFYWPAGAVAYLPTLSATLLLFLQTANGRLALPEGRRLAALCLTIAALSSEMGATWVVAYAFVAGVARAAQAATRKRKQTEVEGGHAIWLWLPALLAVAVLAIVRLNRFHAAEEPVRVLSATLSHPLASAWAAERQLLQEILGWTPRYHRWMGLSPRLVAELLVASGAALCLSQSGKPLARARSGVFVFSLSLLLACFLTLAAAYLHFGAAVGERHEIIRNCWIQLSLTGIALGWLSSPKLEAWRQGSTAFRIAPVLLVAGVLAVWHVKPLFREYSVYGPVAEAIERNFRSGFQPGRREMVFVPPPNRGVITAATIAPGTYARSAPGSDYAGYMLNYFEKEILVVRPAGSNDPSAQSQSRTTALPVP